MRFLLLTFLIATSISCGYQQTLREHCHIGDTQTCDNLFGKDASLTEDRLLSIEAQIKDLDIKLNQLSNDSTLLESNYSLLESQIAQLTNNLNLLSSQVDTNNINVQNSINQLNVSINNLQSYLNNTNTQLSNQQTQINSMLVSIAQLQGYTNIVSIKDVCGDAPGKIDEVMLVLSNGKILSSFSDNSNGQNTRFALLSPGNFVTTDGSNCKFTVNNAGQIVNEYY